MKQLPAYPLVTVDPYISVWSMKHRRLYKDNTRMWAGFQKCLHGVMMIDDQPYRFMGESDLHHMHQKVLKITPLCTTYVFEKHDVQLKVDFWAPFFPDDIHMMSLPCSFIDYEVTVLDSRPHSISISLSVDENFCYDSEKGKDIEGGTIKTDKLYYAFMGQKEQSPVAYSGDRVASDWGRVYLSGGYVSYGQPTVKRNKRDDYVNYLYSEHKAYEPVSDKFSAHDILAFDDLYSIEYMGKKLKSVWTEKFPTIVDAIEFCEEQHNSLREKVYVWNKKILRDGQRFGEDYCSLLSAAYRQAFTTYKLVRKDDGELLYLSKNCTAGGNIGTADVAYASSPLFLIYNPELVIGMMNGICDFARSPVWKFPFAPHDLGQYPIADGQTYGIKLDDETEKKDIYTLNSYADIYDEDYQMPVEESGNMLIMAYVCYKLSGNMDFINKNADLLKKWADYLLSEGNDFGSQHCTDDFADRHDGNINLAIKSCTAIKCYAEICRLLSIDGDKYDIAAKENADEILGRNKSAESLALTFDRADSWSLKYNLVWSYILGFDLFPEKVAKQETARYMRNENEYGTPLGSSRDYAKADWMMWASALDETGYVTQKLSIDVVRFLDHSEDKYPFSDWYDTKSSKSKGMYHRPVIGGIWMPVLAKKWDELTNQTEH